MSLASAVNLNPAVLGSAIPIPSITSIPLNFIQLSNASPNPLTNVSVQATSSNLTQPSTTVIATLDEGYYFFSGDFSPQWYSTTNQFDNGIVSLNVSIGDGTNTFSQRVISFILNGSQFTLVPNLSVYTLGGLANITSPNTPIYFTINSIQFESTTGNAGTTSVINGNALITQLNSFVFSYIKF